MISLNWIKNYIDIDDQNLEELAVKITKAGVNVEKVITNHIDNLVIGEVLECNLHPDSDHLHICLVDVGSEKLQIPVSLLTIDDVLNVLDATRFSQISIVETAIELAKIFASKSKEVNDYKNHLLAKAITSIMYTNQTSAKIRDQIFDIVANTYTEQINYVWDDINHTYDLGESTYRWAAKDNYVDVDNHSYDAISVELEYVSLEESVDGVFNISKTTIDSRSNNRFTLTLEGKLKDSGLEYIKVCSINLKLS